jgi:ArsR family transcriptional regulator
MKIVKNTARMQLLDAKASVFKALAHPSRLLMVEALSKEELCVCELQKLVGSDMSTVSKHLSVLKDADIVSSEKRGLSIFYSLKAVCVTGFISCIEDMIRDDAADRTEIAACCKKKA